jgi:chemotaxis signal transduction protein
MNERFETQLEARVRMRRGGGNWRPSRQALLFELGGLAYGVELGELAGVSAIPRWTPVPGTPAVLLGVFNYLSDLRPIFDLAQLLGLPESPPGREDSLLLLRFPSGPLGLRVEKTLWVVNFQSDDMNNAETPRPYIAGVFSEGWQLVHNLQAHPDLQAVPRERDLEL